MHADGCNHVVLYTYEKINVPITHSLILFQIISDLHIISFEVYVYLLLQVESLTAARKSAMQGQEPSDAIRVVNALLTQIDHIKRCS